MIFKKTTTLWIIIMVLAFVNLATLGSLWLSHPSSESPEIAARPPRQGFFLEQRLNFSEEQAKTYRQLRQEYFENAQPYYEEIKNHKEALFQQLKVKNNQKVNEIAEKIGKIQASIEVLTFEHFMEIRELATEEQRPQFDSLIVRIVDRAHRPFPRGEGGRDGGRENGRDRPERHNR
jgi:periplasmic protein CpxP/Spy